MMTEEDANDEMEAEGNVDRGDGDDDDDDDGGW